MPGKRQLIAPRKSGKRHVRRDREGQFGADQVDVGRLLARNRRTRAKKFAPPAQGDRGDRRRREGPKPASRS